MWQRFSGLACGNAKFTDSSSGVIDGSRAQAPNVLRINFYSSLNAKDDAIGG